VLVVTLALRVATQEKGADMMDAATGILGLVCVAIFAAHLIDAFSLGDRVRLLDYDIGAEEERTRCKDRRDAAYSILARTLVARRDNLSATIASLQERVATSAAD
jgi:hypothetical protein